MSRRNGALALGGDAGVRAVQRTAPPSVRRIQIRRRGAGVELIGIVGKDWVVLNNDAIAESSPARSLFDSWLRKIRRLLALD